MLALLAALWAPLTAGAYPPLYDYPAHLLEARIARDFADPALAYADGFVPRPGWAAETNALMTLATLGLARLVPIDLAGRLAIALLLAIFLFGLGGLLRRAGTAGALLPLAPLLAYNFTFASGWLNFSLGTALGLCALGGYEDWSRAGGRRRLAWLALLALLIYSAHLLAWGLLALALGARAAADRLPPRRLAALAAASLPTLALLLATRPALAAIGLIGPAAWLGAWLIGRLRLPPLALAVAAPLAAALIFGLGQAATPWLARLDPEIAYAPFARGTFPIRAFTLAQQLPAPDGLLSAANLLIALLLFELAALVALAAARADDGGTWRRLAPLGPLILLYGAAPSFAGDIAVVEPRVLVWGALIALAAVRLPAAGALRWAVTTISLALGVVAAGAFTAHSMAYQRQAEGWRAAMGELAPARAVLVLARPAPRSADSPLRYVESYYDGLYFSTRYQLERGGVTTRMFGNGPVYVRPDLELAVYLWRPERGAAPLDSACAHSRERFDAVLAWGPLEPALRAALDACFGPGRADGYLTIWHNNARAGAAPGPRAPAG